MSSNNQATGSLVTHFTHPWSEHDKGELDEQGKPLHKCTPDFLDKLLAIMSGLGPEGKLNDNALGFDADRTRKLVRDVFEEITRLQDHPALYPEDKCGENFVNHVKQIISDKKSEFQLSRLITDLEAWKAMGAALGMDNILEVLGMREPVTVWEEYLFPGAPGSLMNVHPTSRVIPPGGAKIMAWWQRKAAALLTASDNTNDEKHEDTHEENATFDLDALQPLGPRIKYRGDMVNLTPNPYFDFDAEDEDLEDALDSEDLGEFFTSLDEDTEVYVPSPSNTVCVVLTPSGRN